MRGYIRRFHNLPDKCGLAGLARTCKHLHEPAFFPDALQELALEVLANHTNYSMP